MRMGTHLDTTAGRPFSAERGCVRRTSRSSSPLRLVLRTQPRSALKGRPAVVSRCPRGIGNCQL